jgi:elongation factor Ts
MITDIAEYLKENGEGSKEAAQTLINSNYALELGENLQIQEYKIIEGDVVAPYVHSNNKVASVVIAKAGTDEEKAKQVAMHVTASNPEYLSPNDISDEIVEKEKALQLEIMKADEKMGNKSDDILLKIIEGKMGKFKNEISLLEQAFVINPDQKVKDFIGNDTIVSFEKFAI